MMKKFLIYIEFVVFVDDEIIKKMSNNKMSTLILVVKDNRKLKENNQEIENITYLMVYILNELY